MCLTGELAEGLKKKETIDICNACITLDIICLTLPIEMSGNSVISEESGASGDRENNGDVEFVKGAGRGSEDLDPDQDQGMYTVVIVTCTCGHHGNMRMQFL